MTKNADEPQKTPQDGSQCHHINSAYPSPTSYPTFFDLHANRLQWLTTVAKKQRQIFCCKGPYANTKGPLVTLILRKIAVYCVGGSSCVWANSSPSCSVSKHNPFSHRPATAQRIPQSSPIQSPVDRNRLKSLTNR